MQTNVEMIRLYRQSEKQQNIRTLELRKIRDEARLQAKEIKNSVRYRLGSLILNDLRQPYKLPLLPLQLLRLYFRRRGNQPRFRLPDQIKLLEQLATEVKTSTNADYAPIPGRVCYVLHNSLPYASGGYATRSHGLLKGVIGNGINIVAVTRPGFPQDTIDIANKDILPHVIDGVSYERIRRPHRNWMSTTEYMRAIVAAFERKFRELRPALVQAASFHISALPAQIAARRLGIPFVYEIRGLAEITKVSRDPTYLDTDDYRFHATMEAETAKAADHVFTLTAAMKEEFVARGVARDKITLLPNSCDPSQFSPLSRDAALAARLGIEPDAPVIGYIGSIVDYEGLEDLVEACGELRQRGLKFRLLIVGSEHSTGGTGPITREMRRLADEPGGIGDWLILTGRVPYAEVKSYYSLVDISPFPRKPWPVCEMVSPMKPLEALATEKAVVVSSVAALTEMVRHDETGLVFEKGNPVALAEVLARLIADPALRDRLGKAGRAFVERERSWHATAAAGAAVIRDLLANPPERLVVVRGESEQV